MFNILWIAHIIFPPYQYVCSQDCCSLNVISDNAKRILGMDAEAKILSKENAKILNSLGYIPYELYAYILLFYCSAARLVMEPTNQELFSSVSYCAGDLEIKLACINQLEVTRLFDKRVSFHLHEILTACKWI